MTFQGCHGVASPSVKPTLFVDKRINAYFSFLKCQLMEERFFLIRGNVQRILRGAQYKAQMLRAGKLEARPFFFLNFKGTPSQE
jgi:hypothetical protein